MEGVKGVEVGVEGREGRRKGVALEKISTCCVNRAVSFVSVSSG